MIATATGRLYESLHAHLLCDSLCQFLSCLWYSLAICFVYSAVSTVQSSSRETTVQYPYQLEAAQLGDKVRLNCSLRDAIYGWIYMVTSVLIIVLPYIPSSPNSLLPSLPPSHKLNNLWKISFDDISNLSDMIDKEVPQCLFTTGAKEGQAHPLTGSPPCFWRVALLICEHIVCHIYCTLCCSCTQPTHKSNNNHNSSQIPLNHTLASACSGIWYYIYYSKARVTYVFTCSFEKQINDSIVALTLT